VLTTKAANISIAEFEQTCSEFVGEISQMPPMFSALKHEGKALYEYARAGIEIERKSRLINIHRIVLNNFESDIGVVTVTCTKGTYIRTLAEDIGNKLGCGAHLVGLRRTHTANYHIGQAVSLEQFESMTLDQRFVTLMPMDSAVLHLPSITLDDDRVHYLQQGQTVLHRGVSIKGLLRLYNEKKEFLGLGEQTGDGKIAPKRLIISNDNLVD